MVPMMRTYLVALSLTVLPLVAHAQDSAQVKKLFEAGQYEKVIDAAQSTGGGPDVVYAAAQSAQKLGNNDTAREFYNRLSALPEDDAWHSIGLSGLRLLDDQIDAARAAAQQAATQHGEEIPEAYFQLGLVLAKQQDWSGAAAAFDRAAELNPTFAYAHYYAGLMHYRANRPDRMANRFDQFLKLAPNAPERPEVMQIMRTVRGR